MPIANTLHEGGYRLPCTILIGPGRPIRAVNGTLGVVEKMVYLHTSTLCRYGLIDSSSKA